MRVGKSDVVRCDYCGDVIVGQADSITTSGQTKHFCQGTCQNAYLREFFNDVIVAETKKEVRVEFNFIHKQVCPACKYRLTTKMDAPEDLTVCSSCGSSLVCPNCCEEC